MKLWTYAYWDAIDKRNFLPFFRDGKMIKSPHATLKDYDIRIGPILSPDVFMPFEKTAISLTQRR